MGDSVGSSAPSYFVPAAPVWELVRRRQAAWAYSDDEMAHHLGLGATVDTRDLMARHLAEHILRRLCTPAPAGAGTAGASRRAASSEAQLDLAVARVDTIRRRSAAGASLAEIADELGLTVRTVQRIAAEAGLDYCTCQEAS